VPGADLLEPERVGLLEDLASKIAAWRREYDPTAR
jgi:hypothetical protein